MTSRNALCLALALSPLLLGITDAAVADVQVYKCAQPSGTVLYTDRPCKGATVLDIQLGPADPAAPARLAHAQAELDAAATQRRAEEEMAATRREDLNRLQLETEAEQEATAPAADYYPDFGYVLRHRRSREHAHHGGPPSRQHANTLAPRVGLSPSEHR